LGWGGGKDVHLVSARAVKKKPAAITQDRPGTLTGRVSVGSLFSKISQRRMEDKVKGGGGGGEGRAERGGVLEAEGVVGECGSGRALLGGRQSVEAEIKRRRRKEMCGVEETSSGKTILRKSF